MLCQRCHAMHLAPDGHCPGCGAAPATAFAAAPAPAAVPAPAPAVAPAVAPAGAGSGPAPAPGAVRPPVTSPSGAGPVAGLGTAAMFLLAAVTGAALMRAVADFRLRDALDEDCEESFGFGDPYDSDSSFESCDDPFDSEVFGSLGEFWGTSLILLLLGFLCAIPVFLVWFHRVRTNAEVLAPGRHRHVPGMAISAWFVPFANWLVPKQMADDILLASAPPPPTAPYGIPPRARGAGLLQGWWIAWVAANILSALGWWLLVSPDDVDDARLGLLVLAFGDLALIAAGALGLLTVRLISEAQDVGMGYRPAPVYPAAHGAPAPYLPHQAGPYTGAPQPAEPYAGVPQPAAAPQVPAPTVHAQAAPQVPGTVSGPAPAPGQGPAPVPAPAPETGPVTGPAFPPAPDSNLDTAPTPAPVSDPVPAPAPVPTPAPVSDSAPGPVIPGDAPGPAPAAEGRAGGDDPAGDTAAEHEAAPTGDPVTEKGAAAEQEAGAAAGDPAGGPVANDGPVAKDGTTAQDGTTAERPAGPGRPDLEK